MTLEEEKRNFDKDIEKIERHMSTQLERQSTANLDNKDEEDKMGYDTLE